MSSAAGRKKPPIIAHRGWSARAPENTMAAFRMAIEHGVDGIEFDVRLTADNHLVIFHDNTLNRTAGHDGRVEDHTLEELRRMDAGAWFSPEFAGERIPTLEELFRYIVDMKWTGVINAELEAGVRGVPGLEQATVDLIRRFGLSSQMLISSFNHNSLALVRSLAPDLRTAALYSVSLYEPWNYVKAFGCSVLHPVVGAVNEDVVAAAHARGVDVNVWTVNDDETYERLAAMGVDGVITDRADLGQE